MKKAIICETAFQLIVALYINEQFVGDDDSLDLLITNTFHGYDAIVRKTEKLKIFRKVILVDAKQLLMPKNIKEKIGKMRDVLFLKRLLRRLFKGEIDDYEALYCWNYDMLSASIRSYLEIKNHNTQIFIFDEGYITYMPINEVIPNRGCMKMIEFRNKLKGIPNVIRDNIDGLLLFEPSFAIYKPNCPVYKIEQNMLNTSSLKETLVSIFKTEDILKQYDRKYIIFEEAVMANAPEVDDFSIYQKIINFVGKENVIMKLHPRTEKDRFSKLGVKVAGSDGVPWEALFLTGDFSDKVLITIGSGSVTNCRLMFGKGVESYLLFKLFHINLPQFSEKYDELWDKFGETDNKNDLHIPLSEKEFFEMLKKER